MQVTPTTGTDLNGKETLLVHRMDHSHCSMDFKTALIQGYPVSIGLFQVGGTVSNIIAIVMISGLQIRKAKNQGVQVNYTRSNSK